VSLQLTCISGNKALVNCQNSTFLKYLPKSKVLQLIGIYYLCRTVPASVQNVTHFFWYICMRTNSTEWCNPKYLTPMSGWSHCRFHQEIDSRQKKGSIINSEWTNNIYVSITLYFHFHVVNPNCIQRGVHFWVFVKIVVVLFQLIQSKTELVVWIPGLNDGPVMPKPNSSPLWLVVMG